MAKPGFSRPAGNATMSNAELKRSLRKHHVMLDGSIPGDVLKAAVDLDERSAYLLTMTSCGLASDGEHSTIDIELNMPNIRALAAFLKEHFPDA